MAFGRKLCARLGAAALLVGSAGLIASPSAAADGGATATFVGNDPDTVSSVVVERSNGDTYTTGTNVKLLQVGSGDHTSILKTYCIELDTRIGAKGTKYSETAWKDFFKDSDAAPKVNWILRNSYPALSLDELKAKLREAPEFEGKDLLGRLTEAKAAAGTQAAIWHFTNDADLPSDRNAELVYDLYEYFTGDANVGASNEPHVSLDISAKGGDHMTAKPGQPFGPLTIQTTSSNPVELNVKSETDGVRLVRKTDGGYKKVTEVRDGDEFYIDVPADAKKGKATITAKTMATVQVGRVFTGVSQDEETQSLILAGPARVRVTARAELTWLRHESTSPSPTPSETGSNEAPTPTPVHTKAPVTG